jgi:hypothetical protein
MCDIPRNALVGQTSTLVAAENELRSGFFIRNLSTGIISLAFCHPAELYKGITIYPKEAYSMSRFDYSIGTISAISSELNSLVSFQEYSDRVRYNW